MKKETLLYQKEALLNLVSTVVVFVLILVLLHYTTDVEPHLLEVLSSMLGISYILTIRNPNNYIGFYVGIFSSLLLSWYFFEIREFPSAVIYSCIYAPCQVITIITWMRSQRNNSKVDAFSPSFLSKKMLCYFLLLFVALVVVSYVIYNSLFDLFWVLVLLNAVFIATNILANVLVIMKRCECFFFWILSCIMGAIIFTLAGSYFTVLLYCVFVTVNALALINWAVATPSHSLGWTKRIG